MTAEDQANFIFGCFALVMMLCIAASAVFATVWLGLRVFG